VFLGSVGDKKADSFYNKLILVTSMFGRLDF